MSTRSLYLATERDCAYLGRMNKRLIEDEGHANPMAVDALTQRMATWLKSNYRAYVFTENAEKIGYCVYRDDSDVIYIRHFYIDRGHRRRGHGRYFLNWLHERVWHGRKLRMDVLAQNQRGRLFWQSMGFTEYSVTMERTFPSAFRRHAHTHQEGGNHD